MKSIGTILILAVAGFIAYKMFYKSSSEDIIEDPQKSDNLQTQPQQKFPLQIAETPRVDNADQPWYGGSREFQGETMGAGMFSTLDDYTMNYQVDELWNQLSQMYH